MRGKTCSALIKRFSGLEGNGTIMGSPVCEPVFQLVSGTEECTPELELRH